MIKQVVLNMQKVVNKVDSVVVATPNNKPKISSINSSVVVVVVEEVTPLEQDLAVETPSIMGSTNNNPHNHHVPHVVKTSPVVYQSHYLNLSMAQQKS
jgi:hypothetical protein